MEEEMFDPVDDHYRQMHGLGPRVTEGPLKVFQRGEFIGTVPSFPVQSCSGIFDVRPSDFTLTTRDGEQILEACRSIGPGDFGCIAGFVAAPHLPSGYSERSEIASMFDALVEHGANRANAMGAVVRHMLSDEPPTASCSTVPPVPGEGR